MNVSLLHSKRLIIFDCDGVLINSFDANANFFNHCLEQGGYPPLGKEDREKVVYMSTRQLMYELIPDPSEADRLFRISQNTDYTPFLKDVHALFDFDAVLGKLHEHFNLAVATNRGRSLNRLFEYFRLERWFSFRISTVDAEPKPHPEMLLKCIEHFSVTKDQALYLGDSVSDRDASANAGIDYVWVGSSEEPHINSVKDLLGMIR
jgi:HAD superfamily hydrolase (TIGR01549 family)